MTSSSPQIIPLPAGVGDVLPQGPIATVAEVADFLRAIGTALPRGDGIQHFNRLYLQVTEGVGGGMADAAEDPGGALDAVTKFAALIDALAQRVEAALSAAGDGTQGTAAAA